MHRRLLGMIALGPRATSRSSLLPILLAALTVLLARPERASAQDFMNARLIGFAGAQRALASGNDAIFVNPAGLALGSLYSAEAGYADDLRGSDRRVNVSIADSQAGPIAGGISYTYITRRPDDLATGDERLIGHRFDLALASLVAEGAAIGVTARYLTFDRKNGDTDLGTGFSAFTLDAGLQWRIAGGISLGLAGYNLTNNARPELPIGWGAGLGYAGESLTLEGDVRYNAQKGKAAYSGTIGYVIANVLPLRAGLTYDLANEKFAIAGGLGLAFERFFLDVGYRQLLGTDSTIEDADDRLAEVAIRGRFF